MIFKKKTLLRGSKRTLLNFNQKLRIVLKITENINSKLFIIKEAGKTNGNNNNNKGKYSKER